MNICELFLWRTQKSKNFHNHLEIYGNQRRNQTNCVFTRETNNEKVIWVISEKFIRTLKNWANKYMNSLSKNVYVNEIFCSLYIGYINTVHNMTGVEKIKHRTSNMFIEYNFDLNKNEPKFNISDHVNNLKYKRIFKNLGFLLD